MNNNSINEILWTKHELISASKGKDLTTKFLNNDDVLLIAGKGHEQTQTIGIETLPFDDISVVKNTLDRLNP